MTATPETRESLLFRIRDPRSAGSGSVVRVRVDLSAADSSRGEAARAAGCGRSESDAGGTAEGRATGGSVGGRAGVGEFSLLAGDDRPQHGHRRDSSNPARCRTRRNERAASAADRSRQRRRIGSRIPARAGAAGVPLGGSSNPRGVRRANMDRLLADDGRRRTVR